MATYFQVNTTINNIINAIMQDQFDVFEENPNVESMVRVARKNKGVEILYGLGPGHQLIQEQGQNSLKGDDATHKTKIRALESIMKLLVRKKKRTPSVFSRRKHHNKRKQEEATIATAAFVLYSSASPLHYTCFAGQHLDVICVILDSDNEQQNNVIPDCNGRLALHHIVLSICKERISIGKGLAIIDMLVANHPTAIHHFDKWLKGPLDIVHDYLRAAHNPDRRGEGSDEENMRRDCVLQTLHSKLRKISIDVYLRQKSIWENQGVVRRRLLREDRLENCSTCAIKRSKRGNFKRS